MNTGKKINSKKNVGVWVRVSTREQAEGESPMHHEMRARKYADFKEWNVIEVYDLSGVSGKSVIHHPECKRMIMDIERGHISGLIFSKLARLARNTRELLDFCDLFLKYDADLISLGESIDTSTPAGRLFYTLISANAQFERETIAERVAASVPIRAELGKSLGGQAPYGYKWVDKKLVIDETEAPVRKLMFELFVQKKRKRTVCRILNDRGYRTRKGAKFADTTMGRLLSDPIAKGQRRVNYTQSLGDKMHWKLKPEEEWVIQKVPAIVSEELWDAVQAILKAQKQGAKPRRNPTHLFGGLMRCHCKHKMYVSDHAKKYICQSCRNKVPVADVETIFITQLSQMVFNPHALGNLLDEVNNDVADKKKRLSSLMKEKKKLKAQLDQLLELQRLGELPMVGFREHYKPIYEQFEQISARIPDLQQEISEYKEQEALSQKAILDTKLICEQWSQYSRDEKRIIIDAFVKEITVAEKVIIINLKGVLANGGGDSSDLAPGFLSKSNARVCLRAIIAIDRIVAKRPAKLGLPANPQTLGEYIRHGRTKRGLLQKEVAKILGVNEMSVTNWENNKRKVQTRYIPKVVEFLGFVPDVLKDFQPLNCEIFLYRCKHGITQQEMAQQLGIDTSTLHAMEWGKREMIERTKSLIDSYQETLNLETLKP